MKFGKKAHTAGMVLAIAGLTILMVPGVTHAACGAADVGCNIISWAESNLNVKGLISLGGLIVMGYLMLRRMWVEFLKVGVGYIVWLAITSETTQRILTDVVVAIFRRVTGG